MFMVCSTLWQHGTMFRRTCSAASREYCPRIGRGRGFTRGLISWWKKGENKRVACCGWWQKLHFKKKQHMYEHGSESNRHGGHELVLRRLQKAAGGCFCCHTPNCEGPNECEVMSLLPLMQTSCVAAGRLNSACVRTHMYGVCVRTLPRPLFPLPLTTSSWIKWCRKNMTFGTNTALHFSHFIFFTINPILNTAGEMIKSHWNVSNEMIQKRLKGEINVRRSVYLSKYFSLFQSN